MFGRADRLVTGRFARLAGISVLALALAGLLIRLMVSGSQGAIGLVLVIPAAQLTIYRFSAGAFERKYGRRPVSTFGEFSEVRFGRFAPDRFFSLAYYLVAMLVGPVAAGVSLWGIAR